MADKRDDIWNDDDEEEPPRKGGGRLRRFLLFLLTLVLVLAVVVVAAWRDGTGFDVVRRWFHYGTASEEKSRFLYDADRTNRFAVLGKSLVVASDTAQQVLDGSGDAVWSQNVQMENPALSVGGDAAVVVDVGGTALTVLTEGGEAFRLSTRAEEPFVAATLNSKGWLAVTSEKTGSKGRVAVYGPEGPSSGGDPRFEFFSLDRFVTDACVSGDNKYLAAVTLGQEDGVFLSNIVIYPLDSTEPSASYAVPDGLVLQIADFGEALATVADTCLTFADTGGKVLATYSYGGDYLREYDLGGDGYAALLLNRYRYGSTGRLVTVDATGEELGSLDVREQVLGLSAAGRYLAVLYADSLAVYTSDLTEYARLEDTSAARDALLRADGSVLILGAEQAQLYLP